MAKKNEILLSIALEGDSEVKSKLQAVGEAGKKSLGDIERNVSRAGSAVEKFSDPLGGLQKALAPLTEASGLAGLGGLGGIFSSLASGLTSPAGIVAGITSALLGMAKLGDETQRQKGRLTGLGDAGGFGKLTDQAKQLGTNVSDLQPRYEKFLAVQQKLRSENRSIINPPNFVPGQAEEAASGVRVVGSGGTSTPATGAAFQAFDRALFELIQKDVGNADQAHRVAGDFEGGLFSNGKLTGDQLRQLQQTSPGAANFLTSSLSQRLGRGFANPNDLATLLDRGGAQVSATDLINAGSKRAPEADKQAEAARGVTEAFGSLEAASKRLAEKFGGDHAGLTKGIDKAAQLVDQGATGVDQFLNGAANLPGGNNFIGPVRPQDDLSKPPSSLGEVFSSDKGDLLGRLVGFIRGGAQTSDAGGGNPFGAITDFLTKAATNPAALQEKARPAEAPVEPAAGVQPPQPAAQQSGVFQSLIDNLTAALNGKQNLKVDEPASGLDIRGDAEQLDDGLKQLVSVVAEATASLKQQQNGAQSEAVTAVGGGHIRGPGSSTSDSIPAMLSDGEYVMRAEAVRRMGVDRLDAINSGVGHYAAGGNVSADASSLTGGNHQITATPDGGAIIDGVLYPKGSAILDDPGVRQKIAESLAGSNSSSSRRKYKSDFVGNFGGHEFDTKGSFAHGGAVQRLANGGAVGSRASRLAGVFGRFAGGGIIDVSHLALGGAVGALESVPAAENLGTGSPWSDMPHLGSMDVTTDHGSARVVGPEDTLRHMVRNARDAEVVQTGPSPSWNR